jgi:hypothetical protein
METPHTFAAVLSVFRPTLLAFQFVFEIWSGVAQFETSHQGHVLKLEANHRYEALIMKSAHPNPYGAA